MRRLLILGMAVLGWGCESSRNGAAVDAAIKDAPIVGIDGAMTVDAGPDARLGGADAGPLVNDAGQALCQTKTGTVVCACSDGKDNDTDQLVDAADPECTGPQDNDESSYATGIPGDNMDTFVQDCFFDGDSGGGNDGCRWDIRCVNPPNGQHCNNNQVAGCEKCKPLVPNGCDCFGCCDVYVSGVVHTVRIIDGCTAAVINDPNKCPACTKVAECMNTCEPCEVCIGKPEPDPSCQLQDGGVPGICPAGIVPCPPPDYHCSQEERCVTGCCQKFLD